MHLDFTPAGEKGLLDSLAESMGSSLEEGMLTLPSAIGKGYIKGYDFEPTFRMMVAQCTLVEDVSLSRVAVSASARTITFSFRNVINPPDERLAYCSRIAHDYRQLPSVQVSSDTIALDLFFPAQAPINTILMTIQVDLLISLLNQGQTHPLLQTMVASQQPYVYEELVSSQIQTVAAQILNPSIPNELHTFYMKIKAQELMCLFLVDLVKREQAGTYGLKKSDVQTLYSVRDKLLADLSLAPTLPELARFSGMSESKLKRLFKQIFGVSLYQYYQGFRLREAAYLIKAHHLSITEVGLQLGFTNLSHFSRLFEQHIGLKPKKYSTT